MRRLSLLVVGLAVPTLPLLMAPPAVAAGNVYCVDVVDPSCTEAKATVPLALTAAMNSPVDDVVLIGAHDYDDGPWVANGNGHALLVKGAGAGQTTMTIPSSPTEHFYVSVIGGATVEDLTVTLAPGVNSSNDVGVSIDTGSLARVVVDGAGTTNAKGVSTTHGIISDSTFLLPPDDPSGNVAIYLNGGNSVTDVVATGWRAVAVANDTVDTDSISRARLTASQDGVFTDGGTSTIDDTLVDLGTSADGMGLHAENNNASSKPMVINANHLTIVGGGGFSRGVRASANSATAQQTTSVHLDNSVIRGPAVSLQVVAGHSGNVGQVSTATVTATYSAWTHSSAQTTSNLGGTATIVTGEGALDDVDPLFVDAAGGNYQLKPGSPLVDKGDPAAAGPALDLVGHARVDDGDGVPGARRDIGAYELQVAPDTQLTSGPNGLTNDPTPTFGFASEVGATFKCKLDSGAEADCTSPFTSTALPDGSHTFTVRATDTAGNPDPTAATRSFTVDATPPDTAISKAPPKRTTAARIKVRFPWLDSGSPRFECRLDKGAWKACTSPYKAKVKVGKHTIEVRAIDAAGNVDQTPAKVRFRRIRTS